MNVWVMEGMEMCAEQPVGFGVSEQSYYGITAQLHGLKLPEASGSDSRVRTSRFPSF